MFFFFKQKTAYEIMPSLVGSEMCIRDRYMTLSNSKPRYDNPIQYIVLHFSSLCTVVPSHSYHLDAVIQNYQNNGVSAHYIIDRDGIIHRLVADNRVSWHAGPGKLPWRPAVRSLNNISIGIEILAIGNENDMAMFMSREKFRELDSKLIGYTPQQYEAIRGLMEQLSQKYNIPYDRCNIVGHVEWQPEGRTDPGEALDWEKLGLSKTRKPGECESK
eukprot:TRINITY_DN1774_c0_g1_i2.p1 TRINITY_DN1774_c0_g1~~TRINITY_DN1774_c0_g1_i2.p1  ORF type:complete len:217 (+),score=43.50 TRINITY_DN1774_c0_g1_i2:65-715(+)